MPLSVKICVSDALVDYQCHCTRNSVFRNSPLFLFGNSVTLISDADYWHRMGPTEIQRALQETLVNTGTAKNIILCIGDGMSIPTLAAARIYKGQRVKGNIEGAEREYLTFERLDHMGHSKVS